jgi:Zn-dependent oligopeptidase
LQELGAWDVPYFTHKVKRAWLQLGSGAEFAPYLSLGACMEGLDQLLHSLYGIRLENAEMNPGESWAPDVYKLAGTCFIYLFAKFYIKFVNKKKSSIFFCNISTLFLSDSRH